LYAMTHHCVDELLGSLLAALVGVDDIQFTVILPFCMGCTSISVTQPWQVAA
jgi:hypothetical protein